MSESAKDLRGYKSFDLVKSSSGRGVGRVLAIKKDGAEDSFFHHQILQAHGHHSKEWDNYKLGFADASGENEPKDLPAVLTIRAAAEPPSESATGVPNSEAVGSPEYPYRAIHHAGGLKGGDIPVMVIGSYGTGPDGREYLKIVEGAGGIPADEVERVKDDPSHAFPESSTGRAASSANLNRDEGDRETTTVTTEAVASKEYDDAFRERLTNAGSILELKGEFERKLQSKAIEARGVKTLEELSMLDPRWAEDIRREVCSGVLFEYF